MQSLKTRNETAEPLALLAVGHATVDLVGDGRRLGGAASYISLAAARLGLRAGIVTCVSSDFPCWDQLAGVEVHAFDSPETTVFENTYRNGVRHQRIHSVAAPILPEHLERVTHRLARNAVTLYCPVVHEIQAPLRPLAPHGLCAVAPQGFFRRWGSDGVVSIDEWDGAEEALRETDVVCMSEEDAHAPEALADRFPGIAFVITKAERGCRVYAGGDIVDYPAHAVNEVDPTGAGDVFAAAFLAALREGKDVVPATRFATSAASFAVETAGTAHLPTRVQIESRL